MKLEQGDSFEVRNAAWIREHLPFYEQVWAAFIGHNGRGLPCPIEGLDEPTEQNRKRFYQAHYSFARKMFVIDIEAKRISQTMAAAKDHESFDSEMDELFCLMAHVGYVRDMFKIIDETLLASSSLWNPLKSFYDERSHIIHGALASHKAV